MRAMGDGLRLCDYFDLIGGTSTGSIIAAGLACGMSVAELKTLYHSIGMKVFERDDGWISGLLKVIVSPRSFPRSR